MSKNTLNKPTDESQTTDWDSLRDIDTSPRPPELSVDEQAIRNADKALNDYVNNNRYTGTDPAREAQLREAYADAVQATRVNADPFDSVIVDTPQMSEIQDHNKRKTPAMQDMESARRELDDYLNQTRYSGADPTKEKVLRETYANLVEQVRQGK
jgi:hypothetical protein